MKEGRSRWAARRMAGGQSGRSNEGSMASGPPETRRRKHQHLQADSIHSLQPGRDVATCNRVATLLLLTIAKLVAAMRPPKGSNTVLRIPH